MMFRRKDTFACWQNNGSWSDFNKWMEAQWGGSVAYGKPGNPDITRTPGGELHVVTRRGQMTADIGDWMFKSTEGEILCVPIDVFDQMFEAVPTPEQLELEDMRLDKTDIATAVWVSLGSAAVCWEDGAGGGAYAAGDARRIGEQLLDRIKHEIRVQVEAALDAVAPLHAKPDEIQNDFVYIVKDGDLVEGEVSDEVLAELDKFTDGGSVDYEAVVEILKKVDRNARNWGVQHGRQMEHIASTGQPFPAVDNDIRKEM